MALVALGSVVPTVGFAAPKKTQIAKMALVFRATGPPQGKVYALVPVRVCGARGVTTFRVSQRKTLGGRVRGSARDQIRKRQTRRCQTFSLELALTNDLLGVGRYTVAVRARSNGLATSRIVRRSNKTND